MSGLAPIAAEFAHRRKSAPLNAIRGAVASIALLPTSAAHQKFHGRLNPCASSFDEKPGTHAELIRNPATQERLMLDRNSIFALAAISTLAAVTLAPTDASAIPGGFDGAWSVQITTSRGTCSSGVSFGVEVRGGVVHAAGVVDVQGKIAANGATQVRIAAGNQSASGSGRLSGNSGGGKWQGVGSQGACSGIWSASRR
jgi:hypothetical protein